MYLLGCLLLFPFLILTTIFDFLFNTNTISLIESTKLYKWLERQDMINSQILITKRKITRIFARASYKTDIVEAYDLVDNLPDFDYLDLTEKEKKKVQDELYEYINEHMIPRYRHRIAVL